MLKKHTIKLNVFILLFLLVVFPQYFVLPLINAASTLVVFVGLGFALVGLYQAYLSAKTIINTIETRKEQEKKETNNEA